MLSIGRRPVHVFEYLVGTNAPHGVESCAMTRGESHTIGYDEGT